MDKKWYPCEQCGKLLSSYKCYWRHKKLLHRNSEKTGGGFDDLYQSRFFEKQALQPLGNECQQSSVAKDQYGENFYSADKSRDFASYSWCYNGLPLLPPPTPPTPPPPASVDRYSNNIVEAIDNGVDIATYTWRDNGSIEKNHSTFLPRDVRAIIVGKSGCGKTTLLTYLLLEPNMMDYENLMLCGRSLHQREYRIMQMGFDKGLSKNQIRRIFKKQDHIMKEGGVDM